MTMTRHTIIIGDSRRMAKVSDSSVQLIVTSPPYWNLKDYGADGQIGFNDTYDQYIDALNIVWEECVRVLSPGCKLCVNIGDQFIRAKANAPYRVLSIKTDVIKACQHLSLDYMGSIIWHKITTTRTTGGGSVMGSFPYPRNGILKLNYEYIAVFKKPGLRPPPANEQRESSRMTKDEWNEYFSAQWHIKGVRQKEHPAMFPGEIPKRLIKMYSFENETVLDPFLGSGTTCAVAMALNRHSVGYEINEAYLSVIRDKMRRHETAAFPADVTYEFETEHELRSD